MKTKALHQARPKSSRRPTRVQSRKRKPQSGYPKLGKREQNRSSPVQQQEGFEGRLSLNWEAIAVVAPERDGGDHQLVTESPWLGLGEWREETQQNSELGIRNSELEYEHRAEVGKEWESLLLRESKSPAEGTQRAPGIIDSELKIDSASEEMSVQELMDQAAIEQQTGLPFRSVLEGRLGRSLEQIEVFAGTPGAQAVTEALGAKAATREQQIFLAESHPSLETVAHEVVHALQVERGNTVIQQEQLSDEAPAEQEAIALSNQVVRDLAVAEGRGDWVPVTVRESISPLAIACFREGTDKAASEPDPAQKAFDEALKPPQEQTQGKARTAGEGGQAVAAPAKLGEPTAELGLIPQAAVAEEKPTGERLPQEEPKAEAKPPETAAQLEGVPELKVPPPPEPGIKPEDVKEHQKQMEQAKEALAKADKPVQYLNALAGAPPTVQLQRSAQAGQDMNQVAGKEEKTFQNKLPKFSAKLSGKVEPVKESRVTPPTSKEEPLEAKPPEPTPKPDIPPTKAPGRYTANQKVVTGLEVLSSEAGPQRAEAIAESLNQVKTIDPDMPKFDKAPEVPQQGETDPKRLAAQSKTVGDRAEKTRQEMEEKILKGPGPEKVQPRNMDVPVPINKEELGKPEVKESQPPAALEEMSQTEVPAEVQVALDQNQQQKGNSLAGAQEQLNTVTQERDRVRQAHLDKANQESERQTRQADREQRQQVQQSREQIQKERKGAIAQQKAEVKKLDKQIEKRRKDDRGKIGKRVKSDRDKIEAKYREKDKEAQAKIKVGEKKAVKKKQEAEQKAKNQGWFSRALSFIKTAFSALTKAIGVIFEGIRKAVNLLLDAAKFFATGLINLAVAFIKLTIAAYALFLKGAISLLIGTFFPKLAARLNAKIDAAVKAANAAIDKAANWLKKGIAAIVKGLKKGLNAVLKAFQKGLQRVMNLLTGAIASAWKAFGRMVLEAVLKVAGIKPKEFYKFVGEGEKTFATIKKDPKGFVGNLIAAVKLGISNFAKNFFKYLVGGIIGWLTSALSSAQITIPKKFDLFGVFDLVRQVLGLTYELLRKKAVKLIGEKNVAVIEQVTGYLKTLITKGWKGFFEQIKGQLGGLKDTVLNALKEFLVTRVILAAVTKLGTMFNPVGAIVQLVIMAWQFFTFIGDQLARLVQLLQAVVKSVTEIAAKKLKPAAKRIEEVLANLLPIAIDLLARLLGLGGIAKKVQDVLKKVQKRVEKAIDKMLLKVKKLFRRKKDKGKKQHLEQTIKIIRPEIKKLLKKGVNKGTLNLRLNTLKKYYKLSALKIYSNGEIFAQGSAKKKVAESEEIQLGKLLKPLLEKAVKEYFGETFPGIAYGLKMQEVAGLSIGKKAIIKYLGQDFLDQYLKGEYPSQMSKRDLDFYQKVDKYLNEQKLLLLTRDEQIILLKYFDLQDVKKGRGSQKKPILLVEKGVLLQVGRGWYLQNENRELAKKLKHTGTYEDLHKSTNEFMERYEINEMEMAKLLSGSSQELEDKIKECQKTMKEKETSPEKEKIEFNVANIRKLAFLTHVLEPFRQSGATIPNILAFTFASLKESKLYNVIPQKKKKGEWAPMVQTGSQRLEHESDKKFWHKCVGKIFLYLMKEAEKPDIMVSKSGYDLNELYKALKVWLPELKEVNLKESVERTVEKPNKSEMRASVDKFFKFEERILLTQFKELLAFHYGKKKKLERVKKKAWWKMSASEKLRSTFGQARRTRS